jgi:hypothetical protein
MAGHMHVESRLVVVDMQVVILYTRGAGARRRRVRIHIAGAPFGYIDRAVSNATSSYSSKLLLLNHSSLYLPRKMRFLLSVVLLIAVVVAAPIPESNNSRQKKNRPQVTKVSKTAR